MQPADNPPADMQPADSPAFDPSAQDELIYSKVLEVIRLLQNSNRKIVLAESCTGGLVAGWFASVPGVSEVFCGSMVVYRNDSKSQWLGVDSALLANPEIGPVGEDSSRELAKRVLERTPEADCALSITGHFGPNAPEHLNQRVFMGWSEASRGSHQGPKVEGQVWVSQGRLEPPTGSFAGNKLCSETPVHEVGNGGGVSGGLVGLQGAEAWRVRRTLQNQAVEMLLEFALERLKNRKIDKSGRNF